MGMGIKLEQKHLFGILYVCLAASILADVLVKFHGQAEAEAQAHTAFLWQTIPGFSAIYGFVGCVLIIVVSKSLGHLWLQREEDYYEKH